jgi:hypothetical protein
MSQQELADLRKNKSATQHAQQNGLIVGETGFSKWKRLGQDSSYLPAIFSPFRVGPV